MCCADMRYQVTRRCAQHDDPFECPDRVIVHSVEFGVWGLVIHDGGRAVVEISFCPWCGAKLG
ncbi:hypothetical protein GCM10010468_67430 [Actinocorallia longicatena]|uniref:DUF6980 domain-containing protein n=2 Tax=Actinocorallia longicatena TaxID=111803 RepID=A0ABP6QIY5_9ACTN